MHARHHSPGNGYRSASMGMGGVAATSRISPESSVRGHVMFGSAYRNSNRCFGRGQPKSFQPPQPSLRRFDIFVEAGRLATEYLVSKGVLPPNVLSGKWQNGSLKNQAVDFQFLRAQEGDNLQEGRTSALARLSDSGSDAGSGSGRRRFPDDPLGSRNYMKGRRRIGSFKSSGSELNHEIGRSGSWAEKARASPDKEGDGDALSAYLEEQQAGKDDASEEQKLFLSDLAPKTDVAGNSESTFEKNQSPNNVGSKASSSITGKDIPLKANVESTERDDCMKILNTGTGEVRDDSRNGESEKPSATEDIPIQCCTEDDNPANKSGSDLLTLCRFVKVPTRTRSSLTIRGSKIDPVLIAEDENTNESGISRESGVHIEDISMGILLGDAPSDQSQNLKCTEPNVSEAPSVDDPAELDLAYKVGQGLCTNSRSFPERSFMNELETSEIQLGFGRCCSMVMERGEKRSLQHIDSREGAKKPRKWNPSDSLADEYLNLSNSRGKQQSSHEGRSSGEEVILAADEESSVDISVFPKARTEPCIEYAEEKHLFPGSFKICDLNLMEASDVNENLDASSILNFPSIPQNKKEAPAVDIDLSMSNIRNITDRNGRLGTDGKEVEVIDLESDSVQEDKGFVNSERKDETIFTGLESLPDNAQNVNKIPDAQDGYGLMISELLGADIPNCSPVPADINSMRNEIGLHHGEGILGDDDLIYMSLGEIPISFSQVWDQQPEQDYEKPY